VNPGPLSPPPPNLAGRHIDTTEFNKPLFRSHGIHRNPLHYGTTGRFRFDAPDGSYAVLYSGVDPFSAFIEGLVKSPENRVVTTSELKARALAQIAAHRPLRLIDLSASGALLRIGADSRLFSADRGAAQLWSKALHDHPVCADGILYPSRLDPARQCVAIFSDRSLQFVELDRQMWYAPGSQRDLLGKIMEHYRIELIENRVVAPRKPAASVGGTPGLLYDPSEP
jgi:hypothetical protein